MSENIEDLEQNLVPFIINQDDYHHNEEFLVS